MMIHVLKSKLHRACLTVASPGTDLDLMDRGGLLPYERIRCGNLATGERFETTAHLGRSGDRLTMTSCAELEESLAKPWTLRVPALGEANQITGERGT